MWNVELDLSQLDNETLVSFLDIPNIPLNMWFAIFEQLQASPL